MTADDDIIYEADWLHCLVSDYRNDGEILCMRGHTVTLKEDGTPKPYKQWKLESASRDSTPFTIPTGVGGVLYPPNSLHPQVTDADAIQKLAPTADDLWFFWMASLKGTTFRKVGPSHNAPLIIVPGSQHVSLASINNKGEDDLNTVQMKNLIRTYGIPKTWVGGQPTVA